MKTETEEDISRNELERRKMKIDEEINRRLKEDREKRKRYMCNDKENTTAGKLLFKENILENINKDKSTSDEYIIIFITFFRFFF